MTKNQHIIIVFIFLIVSTLSNATNLVQNVSARITSSLDGWWQVIIDPQDVGFLDYRHTIIKNGFFRDKKQTQYDLTEYNFAMSDSLIVPGDWNTQTPYLFWYEGTVWYRREFEFQPTNHMEILHFDAVAQTATIWLNGHYVGEHLGGFTPFEFDVSKWLQPGTNSLILRVNNTRDKSHIPTDIFDWWNYGGITRSVRLIHMPKNSIQDYSFVYTEGAIHVNVAVNADVPYVRVCIPELRINKKITIKRGMGAISIPAQPVLWSPKKPKLYTIELISPSDTITDHVGFRTISTQGNTILLNGNPIFLRGMCVHEEAPYRSCRCTSPKDAEVLIQWAKELGCNFLRLAHYPHNEYMIREAEKQGILLWCEIPVYWTIDWNNPSTLMNAKQQMAEQISRDKNRCNIIIWSIANETPPSHQRLVFLQSLAEYTKKLDSTRLVSAALEKTRLDDGSLTVRDSLAQYLDVLSLNQYIGWYGGDPAQTHWTLPDDKPVIISEFGAGALAGYDAKPDVRWSEQFQQKVYTSTIKMLEQIPNLAGMTPWVLMDFRSPRRPLAGIQDGFNRKGLIAPNGHHKKAFYTLQHYYQQRKREEDSTCTITHIHVDATNIVDTITSFWTSQIIHPTESLLTPEGLRLLHTMVQTGAAKQFIRIYNQPERAIRFLADSSIYYDWNFFDQMVDTILATGNKPAIVFFGMPTELARFKHAVRTRPTGAVVSTSPPTDYLQWQNLCRDFAHHLRMRYGETELAQWTLRCWNEPDGSFWYKQDIAEYCRLYDHFAYAVKSECPSLPIGGPAFTGPISWKKPQNLRTFLHHICFEPNAATMQIGTPLDFISIHTYGGLKGGAAPDYSSPSLDWIINQQYAMADVRDEFVQMRSLPIYVEEWGESTTGSISQIDQPIAQIRNTNYQATMLSALVARLILMRQEHNRHIDKLIFCASGHEAIDTCAFMGFRTLTTLGNIDKPILNAYRLLDKLASDVLFTSVDGLSSISAIATRNADTISILINYFNEEDIYNSKEACNVTLSIHCPWSASTKCLVREWRVDDQHANAYSAFVNMGAPCAPTPDQALQINSAAQLKAVSNKYSVNKLASMSLSIPSNGVCLLEIIKQY